MAQIRQILQVLLALVFIASSLLKLIDLNGFELYVFKQGWFTWDWAANLAWLLIVFELLLGVAILLNILIKKVLALVNISLVLFSGLLVYQIVSGSGDENCNCFGSAIEMNATESLIKNIGLLFIGIPLFLKPVEYTYTFKKTISFASLAGIVLLISFIQSPNIFYIDAYQKTYTDETLFNVGVFEGKEFSTEEVDFSKGKHLVGFLLKQCHHCKLSASKIAVLKEKNPELPVHFVFWGSKEKLIPFWDETGSKDIPYTFLPKEHFFRTAGAQFPVYFVIEEGKILFQGGYQSINDDLIEEYFK